MGVKEFGGNQPTSQTHLYLKSQFEVKGHHCYLDDNPKYSTVVIKNLYKTRVWARPRHCANPALQLKLSLKKTVKGTICPLQNLGKKLERKHTRRVLSRYRNCKLKQNVESIFSCTFKVHSKVTFQSHFTEHVRLMLNQAWWTHVAIFTTLFTNMRTQEFKSCLHNYVFCCPQS